MNGPYSLTDGLLVHATETPCSPTLCGQQPMWVAPHDQWPTLHPTCGLCLAVAQHHADIDQLPEVQH